MKMGVNQKGRQKMSNCLLLHRLDLICGHPFGGADATNPDIVRHDATMNRQSRWQSGTSCSERSNWEGQGTQGQVPGQAVPGVRVKIVVASTEFMRQPPRVATPFLPSPF